MGEAQKLARKEDSEEEKRKATSNKEKKSAHHGGGWLNPGHLAVQYHSEQIG